jgi:3-oxoadipate enol-lactonase
VRYTKANGITIHYALDGPADAPVILFVNSIGTDLRIWNGVAAELNSEFRLLRYDMRGHGLTDVTPGPYSMAQLADDAAELLAALEISRASICGLSIGGMVAQQLAASRPDLIERAVFCATAMRIGPASMWDERAQQVRQNGTIAIAAGVMQRWFTEAYLAGDGVAVYRNMLSRMSAEGYAGCCEAIRDADLRATAATIRQPSLVVVGDQDVATPLQEAQALTEALPNARLQQISGAAHIPGVEQPRALAGLLRDFFRETADA